MAGKFCTGCGEPLTGRTKYCTSCGSPVAMPADSAETADRVSLTGKQSDPATVVTAPIPTLSRSKPPGVSKWALLVGAVGIAALAFGAVQWMTHRGDAPQAATPPVASASPSASPSEAPAGPTETASAPSAVPTASRPTAQATTPEAGGRVPFHTFMNQQGTGLTWVAGDDSLFLARSDVTSELFAKLVSSEASDGTGSDFYEDGRWLRSPENGEMYRMKCTEKSSGYIICMEIDNTDGSALDAAVAWPPPDYD